MHGKFKFLGLRIQVPEILKFRLCSLMYYNFPDMALHLKFFVALNSLLDSFTVLLGANPSSASGIGFGVGFVPPIFMLPRCKMLADFE